MILMNSVKLGVSDYHKIVNGGTINTTAMEILLGNSITKYKFIGVILLAFGGLGVLVNTRVKL
jgi:hypothetical protein